MLGKQLDANLKCLLIQISVQGSSSCNPPPQPGLAHHPNARTVTRPFRAAERNWEIQFDRRELQNTLEIDGEAQSNVDGLQDDHAPVFFRLSLASNRRLDRKVGSSIRPAQRGAAKTPTYNNNFEQDSVAPISIKFDDRTVASWLACTGECHLSSVSVQRSPFQYSGLAQPTKSCRWQVQLDHGAGAPLPLKALLAEPPFL